MISQVLTGRAGNRTIWLSLLGTAWFFFFASASLLLGPELFLTLFPIGMGLGYLVYQGVSRGLSELGVVPIGSLGMSLFALDLSFVPNFYLPRGILDLLFLSMSAGVFVLPLMALVRERTEPGRHSTVFRTGVLLSGAFALLGAGAVFGMRRLEWEETRILAALAALNAAVAVYIYTLVPEFFYRFLAWVLSNVLYRIEITGEEKIPREGAAVIVCNHVTFVDFLILYGCVRRPIRFVMDHTYAPGWLGKVMEKRGKVIPIAPAKENPELLRKGLATVSQELKAGELVGIFPEGMLTRTGEMNRFKPGVERIVSDDPVPVVPMALQGLWGSIFSWHGGRAVFKRPRRFWSKVRLVIGDPLPPDQVTAERLHEIVSRLRGPNA